MKSDLLPITHAEHDELQKNTGMSIPRSFSPPHREQLGGGQRV